MNNIYKYYEKLAEKMPSKKAIPLASEKRVNDIVPYMKSPVLDVGCSKGYDVDYFSKRGFLVEGCDISRKVIEDARKIYPNYNFFIHNFEQNKLDKRYNTIYCFDVIEHIFDYDEFLKNIAFSLNKRRHLILTTPNVLGLRNRVNFLFGRGEYFNYPPHIRFFTPKTITHCLKKNDYKVVKIYGYSSLPLPTSLCGSLTIIAKLNK